MASAGGALAEQNYYAFLGVAADATPAQIRSAYRAMAVRLHPDKQQHAAEATPDAFLFLQRVKDTLLDAAARAAYDRLVAAREARARRDAAMSERRRTQVEALRRREQEAEQEARAAFEAHQRRTRGDRVARGVAKWLRQGGTPPGAAPRSVRLSWDGRVPDGFYTAELLRTRLGAFGEVVGVWLRGNEAVAVLRDAAAVGRLEAALERGHRLGDGTDHIEAVAVRSVLDDKRATKQDFFAFEQDVLARFGKEAAERVAQQDATAAVA